jgi:sphingosine kinase
MEIERESGGPKIYSFLSIAWAIIADIDIESEKLRCLGEPRFTIWGAWRGLCSLRKYHMELQYNGFEVKDKNATNDIADYDGSTNQELPPMHTPLPSSMTTIVDSTIFFMAMNADWITRS